MKKILFLFLVASCGIADKIEQPHNILWYETQALRVKQVNGNVLLLESFANPVRTYRMRTWDAHKTGDTIILSNDIRAKTRINKKE